MQQQTLKAFAPAILSNRLVGPQKRFRLMRFRTRFGTIEYFAFDAADVPDLVDFTTMDAKALNDWYEQTVGYRPQVDDPSMSEEALRDLCRARLDAARVDAATEPFAQGARRNVLAAIRKRKEGRGSQCR